MHLEDKNILITGATGFIGKELVTALKVGNEVYGVYRNVDETWKDKGIAWIPQDFSRDIDFSKFPAKIDAIVHLAMDPAKDENARLSSFKINTLSTLELLEYGKKVGTELFLYASSGSVYGMKQNVCREEDMVSIKDFYSLTKYESELLVEQYSNYFNTVILRYVTPYGPGQTGKLIPALINRVNTNQEITIHNEGNPIMNPIFIDDLVEATRIAMSIRGQHIINIGGVEAVSIRQIGEVIGNALGKKPKMKFVQDDQNGNIILDISRMKKILGFSPRTEFEQGIRKTIREVQ